MATWKKILVEGDAVVDNLATADLTIADATRDVTLATNGILNYKGSGGNIVQQFIDIGGTSATANFGCLRIYEDSNAAQGCVELYEAGAGSNRITLLAPSSFTQNQKIVFPSSLPTAGQVLEATSINSTTVTTSWADAGSGSGISNVVEDTSPQLGSDLDTNGFKVELTNNVPITGDNTSATGLNIAKVNTSNHIEFGQASVDAFHLGDTYLDRYVFDDDGITSDGNVGNGGQVTLLGSNTSTTAGRAYYYNGSGGWSFAAVSSAAANASLLAVPTGNTSNRGMLLRGVVQVSNGGTSLSTGKAVYLTTNGSFTTTVPTTSGHYARIVGYALDANTIFFTPSNDYIEIA